MKTVLLFGTLLALLVSCGNQCPNGINTTDPSCPGYTGYGYQQYPQQYPQGYPQQYPQQYPGQYYGGQYPQQYPHQYPAPYYGGATPYNPQCPPGMPYCYGPRAQ